MDFKVGSVTEVPMDLEKKGQGHSIHITSKYGPWPKAHLVQIWSCKCDLLLKYRILWVFFMSLTHSPWNTIGGTTRILHARAFCLYNIAVMLHSYIFTIKWTIRKSIIRQSPLSTLQSWWPWKNMSRSSIWHDNLVPDMMHISYKFCMNSLIFRPQDNKLYNYHLLPHIFLKTTGGIKLIWDFDLPHPHVMMIHQKLKIFECSQDFHILTYIYITEYSRRCHQHWIT